jgi:N-methylhydantoinase A
MPIEFLHWRVAAVGRVPGFEARSDCPPGEPVHHRPATARRIYLESGGEQTVPVFAAETLPPSAELTEPAIVQAPTTTIRIGAGDRLTVESSGGFSSWLTKVRMIDAGWSLAENKAAR